MPSAILSFNARLDVLEIGAYTDERWGVRQALRYLDQLDSCFDRLAANPFLGRACDAIRPGLRRYEEGRHVIFYRPYLDGVGIVRVLHDTMQPEQHLSEEDEQFPSRRFDPIA